MEKLILVHKQMELREKFVKYLWKKGNDNIFMIVYNIMVNVG
jgi:hypothetical protein